jgi:cyclic pyranopterin phosphate synthase
MAAKRTAELNSLCQPVAALEHRVQVWQETSSVEIMATVETTAQTGVEMEALSAASVASADGVRHGDGGRLGDWFVED